MTGRPAERSTTDRYLIATRGWREAYALIGVLVWVAVLPLAGLVLRDRPETCGLLPDGERSEKIPVEPEDSRSLSSLTVTEAWRTTNFWYLCTAFFLISIAVHGFLVHLIPLLTDRGINAQKAAFFVSLLAGSSLVGRAVAGFLADKAQAAWAMGSKYVAQAYFLGAVVGISFLWGYESKSLIIPGMTHRHLPGSVVLDKIQVMPELFNVLRVLVDRPENRARFPILGSASSDVIRSVSETLAGRVEFVELSGFDLQETGADTWQTLWLRGGFPRSFLADSDEDSFAWQEGFIRTFLERDIPQLGIAIPSTAMRRSWTMLAHYPNGFSRQQNIGKRQVKAPKIYQ